jgi:tetratricopeptide (TPR) repeat protein
MSTKTPEDTLIRRYLLSDLTDEEREAVEVRMLTDTSFNDEVVATEQELVDEYLAKELPQSERTLFEANFHSTEHGKQQVEFAKALKQSIPPASTGGDDEESESDSQPTPIRPPAKPNKPQLADYLRIAAMLLVVVGASLVIVQLFSQPDLEAGTRALRNAYSMSRPEPFRISSFPWAPYIETRGANEAPVDRNSLRLAELLLAPATTNPKSAQDYHAAGQLHLAKGELDTAIRELTSAVNTSPRVARYHNDLGVALLAKSGVDTVSSESNQSALEEFERAVQLDDRLLEALFNRAYCNQRLERYDEAKKDWEAYLKKDGASEWANEARENLKTVDDELRRRSERTR